LFPLLSRAEFLALARDADLNLDTVGWSGGHTTLDISSQDTPTITLPGSTMRSRHTAAMLELMGLDPLVTASHAEYVRLALELGRDQPRRRALRRAVRERKHVLYGDRSVIDAFGEFLERAHAQAEARI
jgi:predicted O-linked N-acetylglucosamine transferase (SPINDLY family)